MKEMYELTSIDMVEQFIEQHEMSFLYVSRQECSVCHALLPKIRELLKPYPSIHLGHIDANQVEEVASRFLILTVPIMLMLVEKREVIRADRFVRLDRLAEQLEQIYNMYT
ncbi:MULTISPECIES: thioredoxin family protein [Paenibacillus]|uniref:Thioredoxin family protein n=1 Tax=Paenibacillus xylanilyticus TaxID=248903 RepID=A0A7Y6EWG4_9BACL|nr:thioredoxin family protein [Paenibacillus xylanilyticus]NUU76748.1 thioredoxin family protein [Paenibacillus xylanilyticus]